MIARREFMSARRSGCGLAHRGAGAAALAGDWISEQHLTDHICNIY